MIFKKLLTNKIKSAIINIENEREVMKMRHYFTITKTMTYDLDEIMKNKHCDYKTAIEIAYDYFDEAEAEVYEESEEEEEDED